VLNNHFHLFQLQTEGADGKLAPMLKPRMKLLPLYAGNRPLWLGTIDREPTERAVPGCRRGTKVGQEETASMARYFSLYASAP
jgi:hypothetical protein